MKPMSKEKWLQFIKDNRKEFKKVLKGEISAYTFANDFENIRTTSGATKYCLIDDNSKYVIKWDKDSSYGDTEHECEMYQKAIEKGIAFLFPQTEVLCRINGYAIVIQEKIDYSYSDMNGRKRDSLRHQCRTVSPQLIEKVNYNVYASRLPSLWIRALICIYGKKITKLFEEFTHEQLINDLHGSNVGFLNGKPIVLDFSGYHH